jgi:hypothetical protein
MHAALLLKLQAHTSLLMQEMCVMRVQVPAMTSAPRDAAAAASRNIVCCVYYETQLNCAKC